MCRCRILLVAGAVSPETIHPGCGTGYLDLSKKFCQILQSRGYAYRWREWHEAHCWGSWGAHLDEALEFFFPGTAVGIQEEPSCPRAFRLEQNYPNPFNPSTTIRYGLPHKSQVTLTVFNALGQQVAQLGNGEMEAGYHEVKFDGSGLSSGVYFYRMQAGLYVETKKFLLVR